MKISSLGYVGVGSPRAKEWRPSDRRSSAPRCGPSLRTASTSARERAYRLAVHPPVATSCNTSAGRWATRRLSRSAGELKAAGFTVERGSAEDCKRRHVEAMVVFRDPWKIRHEMSTASAPHVVSADARHLGLRDRRARPRTRGARAAGARAATRFFVDVLGFASATTSTSRSACVLSLQSSPPHRCGRAMAPVVGLHHIMIEVKDLNDVGTPTISVGSRTAVRDGPRRHSNDRMLSFYVRSRRLRDRVRLGRPLDRRLDWQVLRLPCRAFWGHNPMSKSPPTTIYPVS